MYNIKELVMIEMAAREIASQAAHMQGLTVAGMEEGNHLFVDAETTLQRHFSNLHTVMIGEMEERK